MHKVRSSVSCNTYSGQVIAYLKAINQSRFRTYNLRPSCMNAVNQKNIFKFQECSRIDICVFLKTSMIFMGKSQRITSVSKSLY